VVKIAGKNSQSSETTFCVKFRSVACHGCSDFPKMAVFPFHDQNVAAKAAMASFSDFDHPGSYCERVVPKTIATANMPSWWSIRPFDRYT
jgi:hypothetical protein